MNPVQECGSQLPRKTVGKNTMSSGEISTGLSIFNRLFAFRKKEIQRKTNQKYGDDDNARYKSRIEKP